VNWLTKQALQKPDKKFLNELTFKEVDKRVTDLAGRLYRFIKDERRVALYSNNSVDMALFYLALQALQIEVLMLNTRLTSEEISKKLKTLNIRVVFSQEDTFVSFGDTLISFDEVYKSEITENVQLADEYNPEQIAVIMDTSATSGEFKSVPLRWKQFAAHVRASQQRLGVTEEDNWLMVLPMYHISGLTILLRSLFNGTSVTLMEKFDEELTLKWIEEESINMQNNILTYQRLIPPFDDSYPFYYGTIIQNP
jgi:O-succinylbenzoic acid--CoA ligase